MCIILGVRVEKERGKKVGKKMTDSGIEKAYKKIAEREEGGKSSEMSQKMAKEGPRLSKNQKFSEHFSIHCCPPFTFLNSKREIVDRKYSICKSGCFYQKKEEDWICCACQKTRLRRRSRSTPRKK